ncbi:uncharacterized protein MONOS_13145 [Monocercomonoides exilis]|uniref:uncharacterized protein n=1 Tax=Monocercomonoides exilis TaxID=2049356 RepID=UPI003559E733|nr:hypothetical protein MONOS_13145 [Monocercomonoides exilis]|eukprot:MONOS_13145.1-p1 / transcript=MONOS_13145.1 / gene=MONOS_13145 / organism=Monocercomonoides_exilis_PA203 / gene_product=unspecified product / transcript_product=unspecified product / location=Mono_scaffold00783:5279-5578(-) / protein_length=100 / sequence_SO=supercontig / SO=protein_coding / is_pseudo=false
MKLAAALDNIHIKLAYWCEKIANLEEYALKKEERSIAGQLDMEVTWERWKKWMMACFRAEETEKKRRRRMGIWLDIRGIGIKIGVMGETGTILRTMEVT